METAFENFDKMFKNGFIQGLITIFIYSVILLLANALLTKIINRHDFKYKNVILKIKKILFWTFLIVSTVSQFTFMQDLTKTVLAGGGIVAVAVGLASQEAAGNLVSGMMVLISKPFKIGDMIILKEHDLRGTVKEITLSHTVIETLEKNLIMIPNTLMNKAIIENLTYTTEYKIAYLNMDVSYESDIDKAIDIMKHVIMEHPLYYNIENEVPIHCTNFKDSGVTLRAKITTHHVNDSFELCSECRILIKKAFDENGIEIPYPHITLSK